MVKQVLGNQRKSSANKKRDLINLSLLIIAIVLLNFVGNYFFFRLDLTSEKRFTLTPSSKELAKSLNDVVTVKVYLEGDFPGAPGFKRLRNSTKELLDEFRAIAGDNIEYEFIDPNSFKDNKQKQQLFEQLVKTGIQPTNLEIKGDKGTSQQIIFPGAVVSYMGREVTWPLLKTQMGVNPEEQLNNSVQGLEYELVNAIRKLKKGIKPQIAFLQGQHELDSLHTLDLSNALGEFYEVRRIEIDQKLKALEGIKCLIVAHPDSAFNEKDKFIIDQFIMKGGNVLWLANPIQLSYDSLRKGATTFGVENPLNISDQLFAYGVRMNLNLIQDLQCSAIPVNKALMGEKPRFELTNWVFSPLVISTENHPIVKNLDLIKFDFVSSIDTIGTSGIKKTILLHSSKYTKLVNAPVRINLGMVNIRPDERQYRKGFQPVAVLLEGEFNSVYTNRIPPSIARDSAIGFKPKGKAAKMIVVADGNLARNSFDKNGQALPLGYDIYTRRTFGNKDFLLNCVNYLCDDSGLMTARLREVKLRMLNKKKIVNERLYWQAVNVLGPLGLIAIMGLAINYLRKKKYSKVLVK